MASEATPAIRQLSTLTNLDKVKGIVTDALVAEAEA